MLASASATTATAQAASDTPPAGHDLPATIAAVTTKPNAIAPPTSDSRSSGRLSERERVCATRTSSRSGEWPAPDVPVELPAARITPTWYRREKPPAVGGKPPVRGTQDGGYRVTDERADSFCLPGGSI